MSNNNNSSDSNNKYRLGIDAGGTFTDFVLTEKAGGVRVFKSPSTPQDGTIAIRAGLEQISEELQKPIEAIVQDCDLCINGTTVALNALIEKKGVKVGLICTDGHEDSIEIRLGHKEDGYRYDAKYPPAYMLVPRYLRRPVRERIISDGSVKTTLNEQDVLDAIAFFKEQGVESVAISFMWSILNPEHERRAKALVKEHMPEAFVCIGTEVHPQIREYTRTSSTVVNAYLSPVMERYVDKIGKYFRELGIKYPVRYFQSNGGLAVGSIMRERAVNAINSGPASAPQAGLYIGKPFDIDNIITVDMGGTSFDITLTKDGKTNVNRNIDFLRYRIGVPMIQVETLGAGGGSIASVDEFGMISVGPESAGANPGPVCYGLGGQEPTVTDANLILGYLNPNAVLGGSITLDRDSAYKAVVEKVAKPLDISAEKAAYGISTIVNLNMVNGIRRVSIERGYDPRDFALVCAGGAGGMHIIALAEEMGIETVLVPKVASVFCAFGQTISDVKYHYSASEPMLLNKDSDFSLLNNKLENFEQQGQERLLKDDFTQAQISIQRTVEMRYVGQLHECSVDIANETIDKVSIEKILKAFHDRHKQLYTYSEPHNPVELINLETTISGSLTKPEYPELADGGDNPARAFTHMRKALFDDTGTWIETKVYDGEKLLGNNIVVGPAIIEEPTTNIVIRPGWQAKLELSGCYYLSKQE